MGAVATVCAPQLIYHFNTLVPMFTLELLSTSNQMDSINSKIEGLKSVESAEKDEELELEDELAVEGTRFQAIKECASSVMAVVSGQVLIVTRLCLSLLMSHRNLVCRLFAGCKLVVLGARQRN